MDNSQLPLERIRKCRIKLQYENPFFAYLSMYLKLKEFSKEDLKQIKTFHNQRGTAAVDKYGNFYYSPNFINELTNEELRTLIMHELFHVILGHTTRGQNRYKESPDGWNIAVDLCVNHLLLENNFQFTGKLSKGAIPKNDTFTMGEKPKQIIIEDISKKAAEQIYDELMRQAKENDMIKEIEVYEPFDNHDKHRKGDGNSGTEKENKELEKKWKKRIIEAGEMAKRLQGNVPKGFERYVDELLEEKVNWKQILYQQIRNELISDYTWMKRSRKSISTGYYLPSTKKENVEVRVIIDLSGSISESDLKDFLSEICGMAKVFKDKIKITLYPHETKITQEIEINQANESKILNLKLKGGGGTSAIPIINRMNEIVRGAELVIWLTDGYFENVQNVEFKFRPLWILAKGGSDSSILNTGRIIELDE